MKLMQKTVWAITPEMLSTMISIAHQTNKSPEAIAKEMGRDMKNTYAVSTRGGAAVSGIQIGNQKISAVEKALLVPQFYYEKGDFFRILRMAV